MIDMMEKGEEIQMRRSSRRRREKKQRGVEEAHRRSKKHTGGRRTLCANHNQGKSTRHFPVIGQTLVIIADDLCGIALAVQANLREYAGHIEVESKQF